MAVEALLRLIECVEDAGCAARPTRAAVAELVSLGKTDQLLLPAVSQELHRMHVRVLQWLESGQPCACPLTLDDMRLLQSRVHGDLFCEGVPIPGYVAETYRAFLCWYGRIVARV